MTSNLNGSSLDVEKEQTNSDELQNVSDFFEANASVIERWLKEKAPDEVINQINSIVSKHRVCEKEHRSSVTSELYQQWLSKSPLKVKNDVNFSKTDLKRYAIFKIKFQTPRFSSFSFMLLPLNV
jgi:hypothetical protein